MNFFEHQDRARASTRKLVFLFACAVASLIVVTALLVVVVLNLGEGGGTGAPALGLAQLSPRLLLDVGIGVLAVVGCGTLVRMHQLRGGGRAVAESLHGRLLNVQTRDADERKVLNVVEEMAIASGVPVPQVYLLEDEAINAFAAGYAPGDAVIGVTRGCIARLDRDELQGVVAHEFSHIFNGDMRLNMQLMGWLFGITVIGHIGYGILRSGARHAPVRRRGNQGQGGLLLALGLIVIGYGGTFFGNLIKAAVSRQREFLADASAVQFTRNPDGIGGALRKIAASTVGSCVSAPRAAEMSHMFFAQGLRGSFMEWLATHPPLEERIRRIQPGWSGTQGADSAAGAARAAAPTPSAAANLALASAIVASVGQPAPVHIGLARDQLQRLPARLSADVHSSYGSALLMHSLIIAAAEPALAASQRAYLEASMTPASVKLLDEFLPEVRALPRDLHLTLVDLAVPSLRELSADQREAFLRDLQHLTASDGRVSLFEWCLLRILRHALDTGHARREATVTLEASLPQAAQLLGALARAGHAHPDQARAAYAAGLAALELDVPVQRWDESDEVAVLERAMDTLRRLEPLQKPRLLKAMVACVLRDGRITCEEGELLRAAAAVLDCPLPPLA